MDRDEQNIILEGENRQEDWEESEEGEEEGNAEEVEEIEEEEEDAKYYYPEFEPEEAAWTPVPLKRFENGVQHPRALCFGHYLVIKVDEEPEDDKLKPVTLLAVDLRDNSVQEVEIHDKSWISDTQGGSSTITKYKENQIIKFGKIKRSKVLISLITIESFQPFRIKCEEIIMDDAPDMATHTAQIYKNFLYVYGEIYENEKMKCCLWRFDIKSRQWEFVKTAGEAPGHFYEPLSLIFQDDFYVYAGGGTFDTDHNHGIIFVLNFETMTWRKMSARVDLGRYNIDQNIYKGHAIFVDEYPVDYMCGYDEARMKSKCHIVEWWKINPNPPERSWPENRATKKISLDYYLRHSTAVYNNSLIMFGTRWLEKSLEFCMFVLNLDYLNMRVPKSKEDKHFESLFMDKEKSDVTFKVKDTQFPAHKEVLIKRSRYFEKLLNGNPTQSVIEIQDCDEQTFKEFLNHLYYDQVQLDKGLEKALTTKLIAFSDQYEQYDLRDRCVEILKFNLESKNVLEALALASQIRLSNLKNACIDFLKTKIDVDNVSMLIQFLESQKETSASDNSEVKAKAISFILENFEEISKKDAENLGLYESFLVKNFGTDTLVPFAKAAYRDKKQNNYGEKWIAEVSKDGTTDLRLVLLNFGTKNLIEIENKGIYQDLPKKFLADIVLSVISKKEKEISN